MHPLSVRLAAIPAPGVFNDDQATAIVISVLAALAVAAWLLKSYWAKQAEIAKARYAALQALAQRENVDPSHLRAAMGGEIASPAESGERGGAKRQQSSFWWRMAVGIAWVLMLVGVLLFVLQTWEPWYRGLWRAGIICCFVATSILATPIMFRELRRQGVV